MSKKIFVFSLTPLLITISIFFVNDFEKIYKNYKEDNTFYSKQSIEHKKMQLWVDSVFNTLSEEEKIGQLFMVAAYSNRTEAHFQNLENLINQYHIGGLIFFQGTAEKQLELTNRFQAQAKIPLLIGIDAEWGLGMRLTGTMNFPRQMTLGAIQNDSLIYEMGEEIANQCKRIGIHVNFAPVVDVNSNPENPVIGSRSFGENKENVAQKGYFYMKGMQDNGVMANAKHFPGHGDTDQDSHYTLPLVPHELKRMKEIELYPFDFLIKNGLKSMMIAHLHVPAYDDTENMPTTLSENIVTNLLQYDLNFKGLIFTDALNMQGVAKFFPSGIVEVMAIQAGNDVLLFPLNVPVAVKSIQKAIKKKQITWEQIDTKVKKILEAKYWAGLDNFQELPSKNLYSDLHSEKANQLNEKLYANALTLVKNENNLLPFYRLDTLEKVASVILSDEQKLVYATGLQKYLPEIKQFRIGKDTTSQGFDALYEQVKDFPLVIVSLHDLTFRAKNNYGLVTDNASEFVEKLSKKTQVVFINFGSPYLHKDFSSASQILCAYESNEITEKLVPQALFGEFLTTGKLPVSVFEIFEEGLGLAMQNAPVGLEKATPETVGMKTATLEEMEVLIESSIQQRMFPGCQLLIARKGQIIWHKSYGYYTYQKEKPVTNESIFDVASISKVSGTLQAIMYLYEQGKLDLNAKVSEYLPEFTNSNKAEVRVIDVLTHQAGFTPYIPHWKYTLAGDGSLDPQYYSKQQNDAFPNEVGRGIYSFKGMENRLWKISVDSDRPAKTGNKYDYIYSDLSFYTLKRIAETLLEQPMEEFLESYLYKPLGMKTYGYNPLRRFPQKRIIPTEYDTYFRKQQVQGTVHDQGAAMLGGVGGHAGLFGTAMDLVILLQMHLEGGEYMNRKYFDRNTIDMFINAPFSDNRRGLGWDKPDASPLSYFPDKSFAPNAYGHSGFTGCVVWVDPDKDLIFIFLSNRIYPSAENGLLVSNHIRRKLIEIVYKSILF